MTTELLAQVVVLARAMSLVKRMREILVGLVGLTHWRLALR